MNATFRLVDADTDHAHAAPEASVRKEATSGHAAVNEDDPFEWDSGVPVGPIFDDIAVSST